MNSAADPLSVGASRTLAAHAAATTFEKLPADTVHAFKRTFLDFLTCAISGAAMPVSRALLAYFEENDATRIATVIGHGAKLSAPNAALVTGANVHGLDFDDGHTQRFRASVRRDISGRDGRRAAAREQRARDRVGSGMRLRRDVPHCSRDAPGIRAARLSQHGAGRRVRRGGGGFQPAETRH